MLQRVIREGNAEALGLGKLKRCLIKHQTERLKLEVKLIEFKLKYSNSNIKHD